MKTTPVHLNENYYGRLKGFFFSLLGFLLTPLLLVFSFPPWKQSYLAWIALVPFLIIIKKSGPLKTIILSFLTGLLFLYGLHYWSFYIEEFNGLSIGLGNLITAIPYGLFGLLTYYFNKRLSRFNVIVLPALWVLMEYVRIHIDFLSWPLGLLTYSQYENNFIAGTAAFTGLYGVSFILLAANVVLAEFVYSVLYLSADNTNRLTVLRKHHKKALSVFAGMAVLTFPLVIHGMATHDGRIKTDQIKVALVQGNTLYREKPRIKSDPAYRQAVYQTYESLTKTAAKSDVDIIVWPSSVVPGRIPYDSTLVKLLSGLAVDTGKYLLVGSAGEEKFTNDPNRKGVSNSAFFISPQGKIIGRYDKIHLLPFDEYLPLRGTVKWPSWIVSSFNNDYRPGKDLTVFAINNYRFGVQICWENYFPDQFRELAAKDVDFIVSMTNEEGFTETRTGHDQFLAINVFRAIENSIPIIRTATSGISAVILPSGKIISRVTDENSNDVNVQGIAITDIPTSLQRTFYTKHGDWFIGLLGILLTGILVLALFRRYE